METVVRTALAVSVSIFTSVLLIFYLGCVDPSATHVVYPRDELLILEPADHASYACPAPAVDGYIQPFALFAAVPPQLGDVLELGVYAGASAVDVLQALQPRTLTSKTVVASTCERSDYEGLNGNNETIPMDYEGLRGAKQYDTVIALNALDRSRDALRVLNNLYAALRVGGTLIMYERVYVGMSRTISPLARAMPSKDVHQLSVGALPYDQLLSRMYIVYKHTTPEYVVAGGRVFHDIAVVLKKRGAKSKSEPANELLIENQAHTSVRDEKRYFMVWTTSRETFGDLRWRVLETLYATVPDAAVFVYANELPSDMFTKLVKKGMDIRIIRYDPMRFFDGTPLNQWASRMDEWRRGPFFYSHFTDAFRVAVLWKYGGVYIDFDVLVLRDLSRLAPNSFGTEHPSGAMPESAWQWIRYHLMDKPNLNLAVARFEKGAPFLNYLMLHFYQTYDMSDWGCVGPDFATKLSRQWASYNRSFVRYIARQDSLAKGYREEGAPTSRITIYTDPIVFYPIGWTTTMEASRADQSSEALLARVMAHSYTVHVYTQMYKLANKPFAYEDGSLMHRVLSSAY